MLNRLTVSALLKAVIAITSACVVIALSLTAYESWDRLKTANRISQIADASADLFKAMHNLRTDRSSTNRLLNATEPMDPEIEKYLRGIRDAEMPAMGHALELLPAMPNPAGLGALAATLNFIPIIGPIAMFAVLVVVGLVAFPTISGGLLAALAFGGITFLEGHFVTPTIIGRRLALNALAVLLALAFWTWLWGPMGAFLSSPLLIVALILKEHLLPPDAPQLPQD